LDYVCGARDEMSQLIPMFFLCFSGVLLSVLAVIAAAKPSSCGLLLRLRWGTCIVLLGWSWDSEEARQRPASLREIQRGIDDGRLGPVRCLSPQSGQLHTYIYLAAAACMYMATWLRAAAGGLVRLPIHVRHRALATFEKLISSPCRSLRDFGLGHCAEKGCCRAERGQGDWTGWTCPCMACGLSYDSDVRRRGGDPSGWAGLAAAWSGEGSRPRWIAGRADVVCAYTREVYNVDSGHIK
jgi:hypothetical protein